MKWFCTLLVLMIGLFCIVSPASADIIVDCETMSEGDTCTDAVGESGVCTDVDGHLECRPEGDDNGSDDAGIDAGADAGTDADDDASESSCATTPSLSRSLNTLLPILLGLGLLMVFRRRE